GGAAAAPSGHEGQRQEGEEVRRGRRAGPEPARERRAQPGEAVGRPAGLARDVTLPQPTGADQSVPVSRENTSSSLLPSLSLAVSARKSGVENRRSDLAPR